MKTLNRDGIQRMIESGSGSVGGGVSASPESLAGYATQMWVNGNYVSIKFFSKLFQALDENGDPIDPNDMDTVIDSIQSMFGFWTNAYLSALGQNSEGGEVELTLASLADVDVSTVSNGDALVWNAAIRKWVPGQGGMDLTAMWAALGSSSAHQIDASHLSTALAGYATQTWVGQQGYITASALNGYATESWVGSQISDMATQTWVENNYLSQTDAATTYLSKTDAANTYLSIAFFARLFRAYNGSTAVNPNDTTSTIDNIKAMFGFWTEQYISALGNSGGGSAYVTMDQVWTALGNATNEQINASHLSTALSAYNPTSNFKTINGNSIIGTDNIVIQSSGGTVTAVKVGSTSYSPTDGVVSLPAYPTKSSWNYDDVYLKLSGGTMSNTNLVTNLNADLLDGYQAKQLPLITTFSGTSIASNTDLNDILNAGTYYCIDGHVAGTLSNTPYNSGNFRLWHFQNTGIAGASEQWGTQFLITGNEKGRVFLRGHESSNFTEWKEFAYLTSNVASATKLQTARTLWGQSFDGTGDITGNLNITTGGYAVINTGANEIGYRLKGVTYDIAIHIGSGGVNRGIFQWQDTQGWLLYFTASNTVLNYGNVGIGTESPAYKLDVNGDARATNFRGNFVGNADTATKLQTARTIWGQSFDGTANVTGALSSVSGIAFSATGHFKMDEYGNLQATTNTDSNYWNVYRYDGSNALVVKASSGNVGIATTSPSYKLHVAGTFYASGNSGIGGTLGVSGLLTASGGITIPSGKTLTIGDAVLSWDSTNQGIKITKGLYSETFISALGAGSGGSGGVDMNTVWTALGNATSEQINVSHLSTALSGYATQSWVQQQLTGGTVTAVKVGDTTYNPSSGLVSLPAYKKTQDYWIPISGTWNTQYGDFLDFVSTSSNIHHDNNYNEISFYRAARGTNLIGTDSYYMVFSMDKNGTDTVKLVAFDSHSSRIYSRVQYAGTWGDWYTVAFTTDIPTTLDNIADGTTRKLANYLPLSGGTMSNTNLVTNLNADLLDGYQAKQLPLITTVSGTNIESNTDLNDILDAGTYYCIDGSVAGTLSNTPFTGGNFRLWHIQNTGTAGANEQWSAQILISGNGGGRAFLRGHVGTTFGDWKEFAFSSDLSSYLPLSGGTFSGRDPISIDSNGNFRLNSGDSTYWHIDTYDDSVNLITARASGNVGIGTKSPSYKLDVNGDVRATNFRGNFVGNADSATKLQTARTIWGQSFDGTGNITGNLNITTGGYAVINTGANEIGYRLKGVTYDIAIHIGSGGVNRGIYQWQDTQGWLLYFTASNTVLNYGNVGIGTESPAYKLDVNGTGNFGGKVRISSAHNANLLINNTGNARWMRNIHILSPNITAGNESCIAIGYADSKYNQAQISFRMQGNGSASNCFGIGFHSNDDIFNILAGGNVGIGTTNPSYKLSVSGDVSATNFRGNFVGNADSATKLQTARTIWGQSFDGSANVSGAISGATTISASSNVSVGGTLSVTGATTLSSTLGVSGATTMSGKLTMNKSNIELVNTSTNDGIWVEMKGVSYDWGIATGSGNVNRGIIDFGGAGWMLYFDASNTYCEYGNFICSGGVTSLSDARHKSIVDSTKISVEQIARMRSVKFLWNDGRDDDAIHVGSIAQDWQSILPEVVIRKDDKDGTLSLNYGVAALVSVITTARKVVDHERRIKELEKENERLRFEVEQLKIA